MSDELKNKLYAVVDDIISQIDEAVVSRIKDEADDLRDTLETDIQTAVETAVSDVKSDLDDVVGDVGTHDERLDDYGQTISELEEGYDDFKSDYDNVIPAMLDRLRILEETLSKSVVSPVTVISEDNSKLHQS